MRSTPTMTDPKLPVPGTDADATPAVADAASDEPTKITLTGAPADDTDEGDDGEEGDALDYVVTLTSGRQIRVQSTLEDVPALFVRAVQQGSKYFYLDDKVCPPWVARTSDIAFVRHYDPETDQVPAAEVVIAAKVALDALALAATRIGLVTPDDADETGEDDEAVAASEADVEGYTPG